MEEHGFVHKSVLLYETVGSLNIKPGGIYVDGTLGGGGQPKSFQVTFHFTVSSDFLNIID